MATYQMALHPNIRENPDVVYGFLFADLRSAFKTDANKFQLATTSPANYMHFGHGKHDCPERFSASNGIKTIMTYLVRKYDIKEAPS